MHDAPASSNGASRSIAVIAGDGIGPEIMAPTLELLDAIGSFEHVEVLAGGVSIDAHGVPLTDEAIDACRSSDAVLLAALGGPKWDSTEPGAPRPEHALLGLRHELGLFANLRPVRPLKPLLGASTLREEVIADVDLLIVRELTGGIYFGKRGRDGDVAHDQSTYSVAEVERIARVAFATGRRHVTSVDKANVLETSRLWREVVTRVHAEEFPGVELTHMLVDNAAMQLMAAPAQFDVLLTENMFGDILSDEAAMITGSLGMLPSAALGSDGPGMFEPCHGSAPDIAGRGVANPCGMFLSAASMLRAGFRMADEAAAIERAVEGALTDGVRTRDLGGSASTAEMTAAVLARVS
jgi:3-isopropylmalate dehydrogenase